MIVAEEAVFDIVFVLCFYIRGETRTKLFSFLVKK